MMRTLQTTATENICWCQDQPHNGYKAPTVPGSHLVPGQVMSLSTRQWVGTKSSTLLNIPSRPWLLERRNVSEITCKKQTQVDGKTKTFGQIPPPHHPPFFLLLFFTCWPCDLAGAKLAYLRSGLHNQNHAACPQTHLTFT